MLSWRYLFDFVGYWEEHERRGGYGSVWEVEGRDSGPCGSESVDVFVERRFDFPDATDLVFCADEDFYVIRVKEMGGMKDKFMNGLEWYFRFLL